MQQTTAERTDLVQLGGEQLAGDGLARDVHGVLEGELDVDLPVHRLQQIPRRRRGAGHVRVHHKLQARGRLKVVQSVAGSPVENSFILVCSSESGLNSSLKFLSQR